MTRLAFGCAVTCVVAGAAWAGSGVALDAAKALVCSAEGPQSIDGARLLLEDGEIIAIGSASEVEIPAGFEHVDLGKRWIMPGMIDLHSHISGAFDINDTVFQVNPGLRVSATLRPGNRDHEVALASGVTTVLYIPGSGSNVGGVGVLHQTTSGTYEEVLVRDPGSLKVAQGDNPARWGYGMGRLMMNHHIRSSMRQGKAYAQRWAAFESGAGEAPDRNLSLDIYRQLESGETQISTHTQYYQVVLASLRLLRAETGFDMYIDHGTFDSWKLGPLAKELGVAAVLGPRSVLWPRPPRFDSDGRAEGAAWGFQQTGVDRIGFNTDAPVVPQHELTVQAAMGVRYGLDDAEMAAVRGLTIVPAMVAGIDDRLGSLEVGKQADVLVVTGHPADPRTSVERVYVRGELVYDAEQEVRRW
ncbi:MAG: amidohydrolase family protein [Planctomycetes bacterium]|nr:amidohydrolase family protein [Planctomycetota bacterium]MCB9902783.1 amidohydrolase family protein [Planctomycetota bacterium]